MMALARLRGGDNVRPEAVAGDDGRRREGWREAQIKGREVLTSEDAAHIERDGKKMRPGAVLSRTLLLNPQT
jgi:hypothetical protein